jgi:transcriptional regulator with XRE-family HTH domain
MSNRPGPLAQRIASELRAELGRQNLSRRALADSLGQSHVTVSRWINGDGPMSFDALDAICRVLGVSVADMLSRADQAVVPAPRPLRTRRSRESVAADHADADNRKGTRPDNHDYRPAALAA